MPYTRYPFVFAWCQIFCSIMLLYNNKIRTKYTTLRQQNKNLSFRERKFRKIDKKLEEIWTEKIEHIFIIFACFSSKNHVLVIRVSNFSKNKKIRNAYHKNMIFWKNMQKLCLKTIYIFYFWKFFQQSRSCETVALTIYTFLTF